MKLNPQWIKIYSCLRSPNSSFLLMKTGWFNEQTLMVNGPEIDFPEVQSGRGLGGDFTNWPDFLMMMRITMMMMLRIKMMMMMMMISKMRVVT